MASWIAIIRTVENRLGALIREVLVVAGVLTIMGGAGTVHAQTCDPVETAKLLDVDGGELDLFGWSVAISGGTALIGVGWDDDNGTDSGSVLVFSRSGNIWSRQAKLLPNDPGANDWFGMAVAISGDTALVGASQDEDNGTNSGSAYVFTKRGGVWIQQAKLLPDDGTVGDWFGHTVYISGDTAVIGAPLDRDNGSESGSAYVFTRNEDAWTQQAKLLPNDGAEGDSFGCAVAVDGDTAVIGARWDDDSGTDSGAAYIFTRNRDAWTQQTKLVPNDAEEEDWFGTSVTVDGDTALCGASLDAHNGTRSGSAAVFVRTGNTWSQQATLVPSDGTGGDGFGEAVSICGDTAVVGARWDDDVQGAGSAYLFTRSEDEWHEQAKLLPANGERHDDFGVAVSLSNSSVVIGAYGDSENGYAAGAAYVFDLNCGLCLADLNGDGLVNTQDFDAFLRAWSDRDPIADWDQNGLIDTRDFVAYLNDWVVGCP